MANLGYVGLGVMGGRMVKRLLDAGHTVTGYNRTQAKAEWLLDAGSEMGRYAAWRSANARFCFPMVTNTDAVRAITAGADGISAGLTAGKIYVDMSTVSPAATAELATQVERAHPCSTRRCPAA